MSFWKKIKRAIKKRDERFAGSPLASPIAQLKSGRALLKAGISSGSKSGVPSGLAGKRQLLREHHFQSIHPLSKPTRLINKGMAQQRAQRGSTEIQLNVNRQTAAHQTAIVSGVAAVVGVGFASGAIGGSTTAGSGGVVKAGVAVAKPAYGLYRARQSGNAGGMQDNSRPNFNFNDLLAPAAVGAAGSSGSCAALGSAQSAAGAIITVAFVMLVIVGAVRLYQWVSKK